MEIFVIHVRVIYLSIYIYILSSTDRLFRCITTLQTGWMLQAGTETCLTLCKSDNIPLSDFDDLCQLGNLMHFVSTFICLHFTLSDTTVLNS